MRTLSSRDGLSFELGFILFRVHYLNDSVPESHCRKTFHANARIEGYDLSFCTGVRYCTLLFTQPSNWHEGVGPCEVEETSSRALRVLEVAAEAGVTEQRERAGLRVITDEACLNPVLCPVEVGY